MPVIPFYGTDHPELFAIERAAMDRPGLVIDRLNHFVPHGTVPTRPGRTSSPATGIQRQGSPSCVGGNRYVAGGVELRFDGCAGRAARGRKEKERDE